MIYSVQYGKSNAQCWEKILSGQRAQITIHLWCYKVHTALVYGYRYRYWPLDHTLVQHLNKFCTCIMCNAWSTLRCWGVGLTTRLHGCRDCAAVRWVLVWKCDCDEGGPMYMMGGPIYMIGGPIYMMGGPIYMMGGPLYTEWFFSLVPP